MARPLNDYWTSFWTKHGEQTTELDSQSQVFRTLNQTPISDAIWQETVNNTLEQFPLSSNDHVLDLAGGNGLLAKAFSERVDSVTVVDASQSLLDQVSRTAGVTTLCADMRKVNFAAESFDHVILYAGIQYLNPPETVSLIRKVFQWLKTDGIFFIGDIPDARRKWAFFNSAERRTNYFESLERGKPIVGTWFDRNWLAYLVAECGFDSSQIQHQPKSHIYSWFRFDLRCKK